jgi:predicted transcriptional regulator
MKPKLAGKKKAAQSVAVFLRLSPEVVEQLDAFAERHDVTRAQVVRWALKAYADRVRTSEVRP